MRQEDDWGTRLNEPGWAVLARTPGKPPFYVSSEGRRLPQHSVAIDVKARGKSATHWPPPETTYNTWYSQAVSHPSPTMLRFRNQTRSGVFMVMW